MKAEHVVVLWAEAHPLLHLNGRGSNVLVQNGHSLNPTRKGNPSPSGVALSLWWYWGVDMLHDLALSIPAAGLQCYQKIEWEEREKEKA